MNIFYNNSGALYGDGNLKIEFEILWFYFFLQQDGATIVKLDLYSTGGCTHLDSINFETNKFIN